MSDYKVMMHLQDEARSMSDLPGKPEPFNPYARIAELEAEVIGVTSRWEECVDRYSRLTAASLLDEARIAELEDALSATIQGIPIVKAELKARIAELEALSSPDAVHRHYMRGYNAAKSNYLARIAELEGKLAEKP